LTFEDGFSVVATNGSNCSSGTTTCDGSNSITSANQSSSITQSLKSESSRVLAAPNPFNSRLRFTIQPTISGKGSLELYNLIGQKVATVFQGYVQKG